MSEQCEAVSERMSEWADTYDGVFGCSGPWCVCIFVYSLIEEVSITSHGQYPVKKFFQSLQGTKTCSSVTEVY